MKKGILIASRVLLTIVLAFCIFKTCSVLADTSIFQITKIEVKEKSEGVIVNSVGLSEGQLQNDIIFSAKDDYIKYNITIKNTSNDDYTIKSISDNNDSTYLEYSYEDLTNVVVESKTERTFELQIKYIEETTGLYISNKPVSLTLTYEKKDGSTGSETITNNDGTSSTATPASDLSEEDEDIVNPNTGDNINKYIIIGLLSMVGLILSITKEKQLFKTLVVVGLFATLAIPFGAKADSEKFVITFTTNKIQNTSTDLISGPELNLLMHKLSLGLDNLSIECTDDSEYIECNTVNNDYTDQDNEYWIWNNDISAIERATDEEYEAIKDSLTEENIISTSESNNPAYMWFDDSTGTIFYYTPAKVLVINSDTSYMFFNLPEIINLDLNTFDSSKATNMSFMFARDNSLKSIDLGSNFDTSNVTNMSYMFYYHDTLEELDLGDKFDTSKVTDMSNMFGSILGLKELYLGDKFDTSNVTNMSGMFGATSDLKKLDLGEKFDTSNVINMSYMFNSLSMLELDLGSKFNTSKVINMEGMFECDYDLQTIYVSSDFDLSSLEVSDFMFFESYSLIGEQGTSYSDICNNECIDDATYARIDDPENGKPGYFTLGDYGETVAQSKLISGPEINILIHRLSSGYEHLELVLEEQYGQSEYVYIDNVAGERYNYSNQVYVFERANKIMYNSVKDSLTEVNVISTADSDYPAYLWRDDDTGIIYIYTQAKKLVLNENSSFMFFRLSIIEYIDMSIFDSSQVTDMSYMFSGDESLLDIYFGKSFNTSNVTNMSHMFEDTFLEELNLSSFDTSKVTNMSYIFNANGNLQGLNLGNKFDTSKVTDMSYMFAGAPLRELDLGNKFDTSKVTNMSHMFAGIGHMSKLDLGDRFVTSNVINMEAMFYGALMEKLDLGNNFDTSNVTNMSQMFEYVPYLRTLDLGDKFDTSKVTDMSYMFDGGGDDWYTLEELILGDKFDTSHVTNMDGMFTNLFSLVTIYIGNDFDLTSISSNQSIFDNSSSLIGGSGTEYDYEHVDAEYARIDDPEHGRPGYFTRISN